MSWLCKAFGHRMYFDSTNVASSSTCKRCDHKEDGVVWPRPATPKCNSCTKGYDGTKGNGYQPCGCGEEQKSGHSATGAWREFTLRSMDEMKRGHPPPPPPGPPGRTVRIGFFGDRETKESIRASEDYSIYMAGYRDGMNAGELRATKDLDTDADIVGFKTEIRVSDRIICGYPEGEFVVDDEKWPLILAERKRLGRMLDIDDLNKLFKT